MEDMEMTPMISGNVVSLNTDVSGEAFESETIEQGEIVENIIETPEIEQQKPPIEEADMLLSSAKDEGFEEALTHLAEGDFTRDTSDNKTGDEEKQNAEEEEAIEQPIENIDEEENMTDGEKAELVEKIHRMDEQITNLEEKTKMLTEKLKISEANLKLSLETLLAMAQLMKEMIKKEKSKKKKLSLLEFLLQLMGNFLLSIVDPEGEHVEGKNIQNGQGEVFEGEEDTDIDELLNRLYKNGLQADNDVRTNTQIETPSPEVLQMAELAA